MRPVDEVALVLIEIESAAVLVDCSLVVPPQPFASKVMLFEVDENVALRATNACLPAPE
jgi:hypothetical protein